VAIFLFLIALLLEWIFPRLDLDLVVIPLLAVYLFLGMKRMYEQSWGKTFVKFSGLVLIYGVFVLLAMLSALFLGISQIH
jgi:hypothetical protein